MKKYTIYIHKNKINGKVYIGQTSQKPEKRWDNGRGYETSSKVKLVYKIICSKLFQPYFKIAL